MDIYLAFCYEAIFDGLPLQRLGKYADWWRYHERHDPPIEDLSDFVNYFDDAIQIFRNNNFAEEYDTRYAADPGSFPHHQAPLPRHSTSNIESKLESLRSTILTLGLDVVEQAINQRLMGYENEENNDRLCESIRAFISHPHHIKPPEAPVYGGAHFNVSQLLGRLYKTIDAKVIHTI
jgi:hypothetical protein